MIFMLKYIIWKEIFRLARISTNDIFVRKLCWNDRKKTLNVSKLDWKNYSDQASLLGIRESSCGPPESLQTSQHYGIEGFKGAVNCSPIMPRGVTLSDSWWEFFQSDVCKGQLSLLTKTFIFLNNGRFYFILLLFFLTMRLYIL